MRVNLVLSFALSLVAASPLSPRATTYDYVVVGGGTCGLVVANRLTESANITVLVIEAGDSVFNNADVTNPDGYGKALGTAIDWQYPIVAQKYAGNSKHTARAGKAVGGTSTINGSTQITSSPTTIADSLSRYGLYPRSGRANRRVGTAWKHGMELE